MTPSALETLAWLSEMGDDTPLAEAPIDRFTESAAARAKKTSARQKPPIGNSGRQLEPQAGAGPRAGAVLQERVARLAGAGKAPGSSRPQAALPDESAVQSARELAAAAESLDALKSAMAEFTGCNLRLTAKNLVFADGNPAARLMLIGEAPGRDEDIQGLPFVGRSGQLLDRMLAAIGLDRDSVYITNGIPWRPPGNRTPTPAETEICRPFIERHMELIDPAIVVAIGGSSAKMLFRTSDGVLRLRGQWRELAIGEKTVDAMATLHPAYLLRQPAQKKLAWHDLLKIKAKLAEVNA